MTGSLENRFQKIVDYCNEHNIPVPQPVPMGIEYRYNLENLTQEQFDVINTIWNEE